MLLLGLLLIGATGAFTGLLIAYNLSGGPEYTATMFDNDLATVSTLEGFLSGLALALLFCLGMMMVGAGAAARRRKYAKMRLARREAREATAERDALASRLEETEPVAPGGGTADPRTATVGGPRHRRRHIFGH